MFTSSKRTKLTYIIPPVILIPDIMSSVTKIHLIYIAIFALASLYLNRYLLTAPINLSDLDARYQASNYVRGDKSDQTLSDADYYLIRGYKFVTGTKLTDMPPSHPPLVQYLYGLFLNLRLSPYWVSLVFAITSLILFSRLLLHLKTGSWGLLALILFSLEPLFRADIADTMLDLPHLTFILSSLYFYLLFRKNHRFLHIALSSSFLGLAFATKFFPAGISLLGAIYLATLLSKDFKLFKYHTLSLVLIVVTFSLGHLTFFFYDTPLAFIRFQRYVNSWWAGSPQIPPFIVFDLIFKNRWHTWWGTGGVTTVPHWSLTWPIVFLLGLVSLPRKILFRQKISPSHLLLYFHLLITLFLFSFTAVYPRHLLVVLPTAYILSLWVRMKPA